MTSLHIVLNRSFIRQNENRNKLLYEISEYEHFHTNELKHTRQKNNSLYTRRLGIVHSREKLSDKHKFTV